MGFSILIFLALFTLSEFQLAAPTNQADLQRALSNMRSNSCYGFVILLQMLNSNNPHSLHSEELTFFIPSDVELSQFVVTPDRLQDFVLSHSVPTSLRFDDLRHLPTGTVIPVNVQNRAISITNRGRENVFVGNAKIVKPNLCSSPTIKCHGINTVITSKTWLSATNSVPPPPPPSTAVAPTGPSHPSIAPTRAASPPS